MDGGFLVTGRKIFASLQARRTSTTSRRRWEGEDVTASWACRPWPTVSASRAPGIPSACGAVSRTLVMDAAFVPADNEWLPPGLYNQAAERSPPTC